MVQNVANISDFIIHQYIKDTNRRRQNLLATKFNS